MFYGLMPEIKVDWIGLDSMQRLSVPDLLAVSQFSVIGYTVISVVFLIWKKYHINVQMSG